jgi:hypothetical protein
MIGFIDPSSQESVSISRCLVADLNTGTITSSHHEVHLSSLLQLPWKADPIPQSLHCTILICTQLISQSISTTLHYLFPGNGFIKLSL